jgi:hypothetical protein
MAHYTKLNVLTELKKLAHGKRTKTPADVIARLALDYVRAGMVNPDIEELERLYRLPDPR